jgi:hypothetical protein
VVIERRTCPRCRGGVLTSAEILIAARQLAGARSRLAAVAGNTNSNRCLDAAGPSSADVTPLQIWGCTGGANQQRDVPG